MAVADSGGVKLPGLRDQFPAPEASGLHGESVALLALAQRCLGQFALGDIPHYSGRVYRAGLRVPLDGGPFLQPRDGTVAGSDNAELAVPALAQRARPFDHSPVPVHVVGVHELEALCAALERLTRHKAEQVVHGVGGVYLVGGRVPVPPRHMPGVQRRLEPLLARPKRDGGGGLDAEAQHPADAARGRLVRDGRVAIGEVEVANFSAAAVGDEPVGVGHGRAAGEDGVEVRSHQVPDLRPRLGGRLPEDRRVPLGVEEADVAVVVELDQVWPPTDPHRLRHGKDRAHGGLEALRPRLDRPERGRRPVVVADELGHLAATHGPPAMLHVSDPIDAQGYRPRLPCSVFWRTWVASLGACAVLAPLSGRPGSRAASLTAPTSSPISALLGK